MDLKGLVREALTAERRGRRSSGWSAYTDELSSAFCRADEEGSTYCSV